MRLDKFLSHAGAGTRKEVKQMIRKGFVTINGEVCKKDDCHIDELQDVICLDGEEVSYQKYYYIMLNKPQDVVSSTKDGMHETVLDIIDIHLPKDMFPVGRLDIDTTGLLLICNDGALSHELLSPKKHVEKEYEVIIDHPLSAQDIETLENGTILLDDEPIKKAHVQVIEQCKIHLIISEGKYHQVKRMLHAVNNEVLQLKRVRMGSLVLDEALQEGEWRFLSDEEIAELYA
ncbi:MULTISPECIES: pseudouridine synthase [Bacillota]|jgi:16S rRNA pseudouridine516 synthase|uniref:rRNA pseudouridine synthase n=2 Tax=Amedibacillus TaxID=2749846 RepID=A0A7G9GMM6_9FIRM|nr:MULTISPECIES: pseudouridine synthase [Bacillota]QNM12058.1 rRNA pseudouridine synthase [[Eubacterium] hominis]MCH4286590.1 rRNA pseudouridine synthase [Amedibacillus hominis]RGB53124.1 rRNA pseudouridine synthase [Absiella sp. AM22-9]RGB59415.1 rRNA pseudouridine synthase [Absiella sp. AM10-20]RGB66613.1 rRNA pseudouridine synthase [Absiella sp. AM09-45]